jgi:hypothetical protein
MQSAATKKTMSRRPPYRVVQWATGKLGSESLRQIIDHADLELAGLYVYSDAKVGKDAGELCGRAATGITATNRIEDILALDADAVFHMPTLEPTPENSDREVIQLLESGKNVISLRGYFYPAGETQPAVHDCKRPPVKAVRCCTGPASSRASSSIGWRPSCRDFARQ